MKILFKNLTSEQLHHALKADGVSLRLARKLQSWVMRHDKLPDKLPEVSDKVLQKVFAVTDLPRLTLVNQITSPTDGFTKFVFRGDGPELFEAVRIPLLHKPGDEKFIICVSSQAGCPLACDFCATGRLGFQRNLATWEIVDQVLQIQAISQHPVRGVVFMGMGEPLLNYDAVVTASRILSESCTTIAAKAITISTAGIIAGIRRFTAEKNPFRLVVSLTAADPLKRHRLMPVEQTNPTPELMLALREYHAATGIRVTLAWTLIAGVNTSEHDAIQLADLTRDLPIKLDLIDVNDPTGRFQPPAPTELNAFRDALRKHLAAPVARRYSGGQDIHAACGMLAGSHAEQKI
jgi:23S rRNA (adenine2503-C2)-methyltransferase